MANGWNSGSDREAMMRRVAIVLSSLPGSIASKLLGGIDPDTQRAVRRTMASLSDVDPLERKRALHAFKVSVEQPVSSPDRYERSLGNSSATSRNSSPTDQAVQPTSRVVSGGVEADQFHSPSVRSAEPDSSPLDFLGSVDDEFLVPLLNTEHPQTVALVLASIHSDQAGRIVPRLAADLRNQALNRIGRLGEIPEAAVTEVAAHFRECLTNQSKSRHNPIGRQALDAILAAMPPEGSLQNASNEGNQTLPPVAEIHSERSASARLNFPSAEFAEADLSEKLRSAGAVPTPMTDSSPQKTKQHRGTPGTQQLPQERPSTKADFGLRLAPSTLSENHPATRENREQESFAFQSTDAIHQHLLHLSPPQMCKALGKVDTRVAMLTLCGMPRDFTESVLAELPRPQARQVRKKMNSLASLQLREIDQAKELVAEASIELSTRPMPLAA